LDADGRVFVLSVLGLREGVLPLTKPLLVREPERRRVDLEWASQRFNFDLLRIAAAAVNLEVRSL